LSERVFKVINSRGEFVRNPFSVTSNFAKSHSYGYKHTAKRFIQKAQKLKVFACQDKPDACPYYDNCLKYRTEIALLNKCPIEKVVNDIQDWKIAEYSFILEKTERVRA
jgi:hypothetical protein